MVEPLKSQQRMDKIRVKRKKKDQGVKNWRRQVKLGNQ